MSPGAVRDFITILLPIVILVVLPLWALTDMYGHGSTAKHRAKWTLLILVTSGVGAIAYFVLGKRRPA